MNDWRGRSAMCIGPAARGARRRYTVTGRRWAALAAVIAAGLLPAGCGGDSGGGTAVTPSGATGTDSISTGTSLRPIDSGMVSDYGATRDGVVAVRTGPDYAVLERRVHSRSRGDTGWPHVDFGKNMVVAVFLAPGNGGESVRVDGIEPRGSGYVVYARHTVAGRNCVVAAVITHPFAVVQTTRLSGRPRLRLTTVTRDC